MPDEVGSVRTLTFPVTRTRSPASKADDGLGLGDGDGDGDGLGLGAGSLGTTSFDTVTDTEDEIFEFPWASNALALNVYDPSDTPVVFHEYANGDEVSVLITVDPLLNSTFVTPTLSDALAVMATVPDTVAPFEGAVNDTVGASVSEGDGGGVGDGGGSVPLAPGFFKSARTSDLGVPLRTTKLR